MKKHIRALRDNYLPALILLAISLLPLFSNSQTYGGEIQGRTNGNVLGKIGRVDVNLKVYDSALVAKDFATQTTLSALNTKIPSNLTVTSTRLLVDGSGVTQPVSGTLSITANSAVNVAQINGVTPLMGAGNTGTGSQRVTIATDQSAIPVSGTVTATIAAGATTIAKEEDGVSNDLDVGAGMIAVRKATPANTSGTDGDYEFLQMNAGRLWTSSTIDAALPAGTNNIGDVDILTIAAGDNNIGNVDIVTMPSVTIGTFPDNEPFNVAQINGVTPLMGAGNGGTGSLRVNIASDQVAIPVTLTSTTITGTVAVTKSGTWDITNAGTFAVQSASATAPVSTMNSASANSGINSALAGVFDDAAPTAITENSFGFLRMSANRNLFGTIRDAAGNERGANVNASNQLSVSVDNTVTVGSHAVTNAGTFAVQVDGSALTALQLIDDNMVAQGTALGTTKNALMGGSVTTAAPSYTTGQVSPLSLTTAGALRVDNSANTQPVSGTVSITANSAVNVAQINGVTTLMGNGTTGTGSQRVTLASDMTAISTTGYMSVKLDQTTPGSTNGASLVPTTTGGLTTYHLVSAATTNATNIKASAGQVYGYYIFNANAAARKVAFHNSASAPTAGASVFFSLVIPAGSGANVEFAQGLAFSSGIGITTTTGTADSDATAVAAGDLIINIFYK